MAMYLATFSEWHLILVLIIVFLLFGGKKLPELARGVGEAMKEFKKASREHDDAPAASSKPAPPTTPTPQNTDPNKPNPAG